MTHASNPRITSSRPAPQTGNMRYKDTVSRKPKMEEKQRQRNLDSIPELSLQRGTWLFHCLLFLKRGKKEKRSKIWTIPMRNFFKSCFSYGKSGAALELLDYEHHRHYSLACNGCVWFLHPEPRPSNTEIPVLTYTPPATSRVSLCPGEGSGFGGARLRGAIDQNRESAVFLLGRYSKQLSQMTFRR